MYGKYVDDLLKEHKDPYSTDKGHVIDMSNAKFSRSNFGRVHWPGESKAFRNLGYYKQQRDDINDFKKSLPP